MTRAAFSFTFAAGTSSLLYAEHMSVRTIVRMKPDSGFVGV